MIDADLHRWLCRQLGIVSHSGSNAVGRDPVGRALEDAAVEAVARLMDWHGAEVPRRNGETKP